MRRVVTLLIAICLLSGQAAAEPDTRAYQVLRELRDGTSEDALSAFDRLADQHPESAVSLPPFYVFALLQRATALDPSGERALSIHDTLIALNYAPDESGDKIKLHHALLLIQHGNMERARSRLATVVDPYVLLAIRIDKRFDPLRSESAFEERLDLNAAAAAAVLRAQTKVTDEPRSLENIWRLARALGVAGRRNDAVNQLYATLKEIKTVSDLRRFDDGPRYIPFLFGELAYTLSALGRWQESRAIYTQSVAADRSMSGDRKGVNQVINFASALVDRGEPQPALALYATVGSASPYGKMWVAAGR
jgi:tetratricopeptide (TPR) repeat protein